MTTSLHYRSMLLAATLLPGVAYAHAGAGIASGLSHGMLHSFSGLDHLCAMIAVGLWAKQIGGRAVWLRMTGASIALFGGALIVAG